MKKQTYKKMFNIVLTTTLAAGAVVAVAPQAEAANSFKDVKETNTHYANIMNLAERGIIKGYEDGTFRPGDSIKRGNAAHIIAEIIGLDTTNVKNPNFKDISTKNSNYGAIAALANAGIINGFEDGTYRANDMLTRGQMSKIIANAFKLTSNDQALPFTDVQNSQYKENIAALFSNNVTTGVTATTFDAKSFVTRGQLSSFVVRAEKAVETEPTPSPTPNPGPVIPTPEPGTGTPTNPGTPVQPIPQVEKDTFEAKFVQELDGLDIPQVVDVAVTTESLAITTSPSFTKTQLAGLSDGIIENFKGLGTTALLKSVTIDKMEYSTANQLENKIGVALDLALAMGIPLEEAAAVGDLDASAQIWGSEGLTKPSYSGSITINYKDGTWKTIKINLVEGQVQ